MNLDWQIFCKSTTGAAQLPGCFGHGGESSYLQWLLSAWGWTAAVALCGFLLALMVGIAIGTMRTLGATGPAGVAGATGTTGAIGATGETRGAGAMRAAGAMRNPRTPRTLIYRHACAAFAVAWTELFRNIPLLVQVFLWYHVLPYFMPALKSVPAWLLASAALGLFTSARIAEQVRAALQALPRGQLQAAQALGMRTLQAYRLVLLPVALRQMIPTLTSEAMNSVKNSSVAFAVGIAELTQFALQAQEETAHGIEVYLAVTVLYAVTALAVNRVLVLVEARANVPGTVVAEPG